MAREGIERDYASLRVAAQKDSDYFEKNCDYILENSFETDDEFRNECGNLLNIIINNKR